MLARPSTDKARLSVIDEDSDTHNTPLSSLPSASHRPFARRWRDEPPRANHDNPPPKYSVWDVSGPHGEKLMDMRNNKHVVKRGGWKRICLLILLVLAIAVALGVGLGVGLDKRASANSHEDEPSANVAPTEQQSFPAGSYMVNAYLDIITTECTAIDSSWRCPPYTLYNDSVTHSLATFNWIIHGTPSHWSISSSNNPFTIAFSDVDLSLVDANTENEHYTFVAQLDKLVFPDGPITSDNSNAACYFNHTEFSASLYTTRNATVMPTNDTVSNLQVSSDTWILWPGAVEINQTISGGADVPTCFKTQNGDLGSRITTGLPSQATSDTCKCSWRNFDL